MTDELWAGSSSRAVAKPPKFACIIGSIPEKKSGHGALWSANLALVYALLGEADQAMPLIERLISTPGAIEWPDIPSSMTLPDLRLRWEWDKLRNDPRFQKILSDPEPRTVY